MGENADFDPETTWPYALKPLGMRTPGASGTKMLFEIPEAEKRYTEKEIHQVSSQFDIGPEPWHTEAFIEYERTFGKRCEGIFDLTHGSLQRDQSEQARVIRERHGVFAAAGSRIFMNGTENEAREFIERLREFRRDYASYYQAPSYAAARTSRTFVISDDGGGPGK